MVRSVWESMQPWWWSYDVRWCHGWEQFLGEMDGSTGDNRYIITGAGGSRPDAQVSLIMYPRPHRPVGHIIQNPARVRLRRDSFCRVEGSLDYLFRSWISRKPPKCATGGARLSRSLVAFSFPTSKCTHRRITTSWSRWPLPLSTAADNHPSIHLMAIRVLGGVYKPPLEWQMRGCFCHRTIDPNLW